MKDEIYEKEKLTCSIGIGLSKLVAKIASDFKKPDGLTVIKPEQTECFLFTVACQSTHRRWHKNRRENPSRV
jgi:nucleotidyltransferase/DNA polymerase involved in DNA repair